jgi:hypothetical protein
MFPFFLKNQQEKLNKYLEQVANRKAAIKAESVEGCRKALDEERQSYAVYLLSTKTLFGTIKSFIPGTLAFNCRIRCAKDIATAYSLLKQTDRNIAKLEKMKWERVPEPSLALKLRPTRSEESVSRTNEFYNSPISAKNKRKSQSIIEAPVTIINIIRPITIH